MLKRIAKESSIATPRPDALVRLDRTRRARSWRKRQSPPDPDAKVARMTDGMWRLAYKSEHAVDLDTGVIIAASTHPAEHGDTITPDPTLQARRRTTSRGPA